MDIIKIENIQNLLIEVGGEKVLLDTDVANLYNIETRDINKAVKNNPEKFPKGYIFEIDKSTKNELVENFHRFNKLKHSLVSEKGLKCSSF